MACTCSFVRFGLNGSTSAKSGLYNDKKNALLLMPRDFKSLAVCINDKLDVEI